MPCVLNAANEIAVKAFLDEKILFTDISRVVSDTMAEHMVIKGETIEEVISASEWAKQRAKEIVENKKRKLNGENKI